MLVLSLLILLGSGSAVAAESGVPVTFAIEPNGVSAERMTVRLRPIRTTSNADEAAAIVKEIRRDQPMTVALEPGNWRVEVTAPDVWHAAQYLEVGPGQASGTVLPVWPAAGLSGKIAHSATSEPAVITVRFEPATALTDLPSGELRCPVVQRVFTCSTPAGQYDVRMRARGFVSHYQRDVAFVEGATRDVGVLKLREGQSITGRVELPHGFSQDWSRVRVSATPAGTAGKGMVTVEARAEKKGFFHIDGLSPGAYVVRASVGRELYSKAIDVLVRSGLEAELTQPVRLDRPRRIELALTPAVDFSGRPWHVKLVTRVNDRHVETVAESNASAEGEWKSRPLVAGSYTFTVGTIEGDEWYREDIMLASDHQASVSLSRINLEGSVFLGDRPLQASLKFVGPSGLRVSAKSDVQGLFTVSLPRGAETELSVLVSSGVPWIERRLQIEIPAENRPLRLVLPDTILMGEVVDGAGRPVPNAIVSIVKGDLSEGFPQPVAGADGTFSAHLSAGSYTLVASDFLKESEPVTVEIRKDETPRPVRLVIHDMSVLRGHVVSALGPVAGARIHARAVDTPHLITEARTADANGSFESALPPGSRAFEIVVAPPGFSYVITGGVLSERAFVVKVDQQGGTLRVHADSGQTPYLVHEGGTTAAVSVGNWWPLQSRTLDDGSQDLLLPMMDPGQYAACLVGAEHYDRFRRTAGQAGGRCVQGFLPPSGSLVLDLRSGTTPK